MTSKYEASRNAFEGSRRKNLERAGNEYNQRVVDAVNDWYNKTDPGKYYFRNFNTDNEYNNIINNLADQDKKDMQKYLDTNFNGLGGSNMWLNNYWTGNELNDNIQNFINPQYEEALQQLDRAVGRGFLNSAGYSKALDNLNRQKSAAQTTVGDIGKGILDDYRTDLTNKTQGYLTDLSNYDLNKFNTINKDLWNTDFNNTYNQQKEGLQSRFDLATNGLNLFDTSDLIGNARLTQGVGNNESDELYNAINEQNQKKNKQFGLGNSGLF
jgi:hypothetical protein